MGGIIFAFHNLRHCFLLQINQASESSILPGVEWMLPAWRKWCNSRLLMSGSPQGVTYPDKIGISCVYFHYPTGYFLQLKSRVLMTPLAVSPPRSTPEPDISSIPQDAATIPNSATPQALTGTSVRCSWAKGWAGTRGWQPDAVLSRMGGAQENGVCAD